MPIGGHTQPISGVGDSLLWKNAQKKPKKKRISERINRTIPNRIPEATIEESFKVNHSSRITSRHH